MEERHTPGQNRGVGACKACGSRPAVPSEGGTMLCEHCSRLLELPDQAGLVDDDGAGVRREFENRDVRPEA
ncbi:hypothetical protein [Streptomyces rhizosphaerihabitans]|uniref:hypothetical protein n=1 Tax=Streptomyces rhizosphaerihabitans TaxID=1266770 RepID=UPI0021BE3062|nr:hypothetical protein [Streptomyces rhizosphaerihabitans]MCT9011493.1 hypothetical protein [Streptomyces rhizosphaerihabitans]